MVRIICNLCFLLLMLQLTEPVFAVSHNQEASAKLRPAMLVSCSTEQGNEYAMVVEKDTQCLFLYKYDEKMYNEINRFKCSTGETPGAKSVSGDKRTPEGVYFFTQEYKKRDLAPIYGTRAFPTDYPNILDRI
ncbi:MAG: L,D-transpeptidase family protein [Proteobacteria bacterium]|nr:L,D-transpeptidase family protein [Pseudomonadota bacterium]